MDYPVSVERFFNIFGTLVFGAIFVALIWSGIARYRKYKKAFRESKCIANSERTLARIGLWLVPVGVAGIVAIILLWL